MSQITKEQFLADVMHEINMLKEHATPEEKNRLDFNNLNPRYTNQCIYGQMTGSCDTQRAKHLMDASCIRMMDVDACSTLGGVESLMGDSINNILPHVNGEYNGRTWGETWKNGIDEIRYLRSYKYLSSLEGYICASDAKSKEILAYIKGEQDTLEL